MAEPFFGRSLGPVQDMEARLRQFGEELRPVKAEEFFVLGFKECVPPTNGPKLGGSRCSLVRGDEEEGSAWSWCEEKIYKRCPYLKHTITWVASE